MSSNLREISGDGANQAKGRSLWEVKSHHHLFCTIVDCFIFQRPISAYKFIEAAYSESGRYEQQSRATRMLTLQTYQVKAGWLSPRHQHIGTMYSEALLRE
mmetsp:Transcript_35838/g.85440  ORF Transcript_35838/g.85440 Transcript_35838/m.85440 type:complete len:101 (+) Transcript_35838:428-730(+)